MITDILGSAAAVLTTTAFVPQVARTMRSRSTADLSFWWLAIFSSGLACWLVYGVLIVSWPVIGANALTLGLVLILFGLKIAQTMTHTASPTDRK